MRPRLAGDKNVHPCLLRIEPLCRTKIQARSDESGFHAQTSFVPRFVNRCPTLDAAGQCSRTSVARPRKLRKPITSVTVVRTTPPASAGSKPMRLSVSGTSTPASAAEQQVDGQRRRDHQRQRHSRNQSEHDQPEQRAQHDAIDQGHAHFLPQQHARVGAADLAQRQAAHHQGQHLGAGIAAHAGDDRHQHRQRDDFLDRGLELADHARGQERGAQVDAQPDQAPPERAPDRPEQVLVLVQAGGAQGLVFGLFADDVDHVIDGDAAEQDVVVVHHRRADPVVVGELARDFVGGFLARRSPAVRRRSGG